MSLKLCFGANAGVSVTFGGVRFWVDALHDRKTGTFSPVTPALFEKMLSHPDFTDPDLLIYTHRHPDHYSRVLTQEALDRFPTAAVLSPFAEFPSALSAAEAPAVFDHALNNLELHFFKARHAGSPLQQIRSYGFTAKAHGQTLLAACDSAPDAPELLEAAARQPVDLALLPYVWATEKAYRRLLTEVIRPKAVVINHLPFAGDDREGLRLAAKKGAEKLALLIPDVRLAAEPLQTEIFF